MARGDTIVVERQVVSATENMAKSLISTVKARKAELADKKKALEDILLQNKEYSNTVDAAKEMSKDRTEARKQALKKNPEAIKLDAEISDIKAEVTAKQTSLFDYLLDLNKATGQTEIIDNTGEAHQIKIKAEIKI